MKSFLFYETERSYLQEKRISPKLKRAMSSARVAKPGQLSSITFNLSESVMENKGGETAGPVSEIYMMAKTFDLLKGKVKNLELKYAGKTYTNSAGFTRVAIQKNKGKINLPMNSPQMKPWKQNGQVQAEYFVSQLEREYGSLKVLDNVTLEHDGIKERGTSKSDISISWKVKSPKELIEAIKVSMKVTGKKPIHTYNGQGLPPSTENVLLSMAYGLPPNQMKTNLKTKLQVERGIAKAKKTLAKIEKGSSFRREYNKKISEYVKTRKDLMKLATSIEDDYFDMEEKEYQAAMNDVEFREKEAFTDYITFKKAKFQEYRAALEEAEAIVEQEKAEAENTFDAQMRKLADKIGKKIEGMPLIDYYEEMRLRLGNLKGKSNYKGKKLEDWYEARKDYMDVLYQSIVAMSKKKEFKDNMIKFVIENGGLEPDLYYFGAGRKYKQGEDKYTQAATNTLFNSGYKSMLKDLFEKEKDITFEKRSGKGGNEYIYMNILVAGVPRVEFFFRTHGTEGLKLSLPKFFDGDEAKDAFELFGSGPGTPPTKETPNALPVEFTDEPKPRKRKTSPKRLSTPEVVKAVDDPRYGDFVKAQGSRISDMGTKREREFISNAKKMSYDELISKWVKPGSLKKV